jgi:hypothetical protein
MLGIDAGAIISGEPGRAESLDRVFGMYAGAGRTVLQ